MTAHRFAQIDVFSSTAFLGNPLGVVYDADGLTDEEMLRLTRWTNLSECAFLLRPTSDEADYRVRIFAPTGELPFAGHPTVGSAHAWLEAGGVPRGDTIVQECGAGLVRLRRDGTRLAFVAPDPTIDQPIFETELDAVADGLGIPVTAVLAHRVLACGPVWHIVVLDTARRVRELRPEFSGLRAEYPTMSVGAVGFERAADGNPDSAWRDGEPLVEVRGFPVAEGIGEDPVTGSLNAAIGQWLLREGKLPDRYVAAQGSALGREGRLYVQRLDGEVWVGGDATTCIRGDVTL